MTRIALVTGGSRGIGREIVLTLGHQGFRVAIAYNEREDLALEVVQVLRQTGCNALAIRMAVEDRESVRGALAQVHDQLGPVDVLVNNAAIAQEKPFETITDEDWDRMHSVNLRGPFICAQECLPLMIHQGWGRIINITSIENFCRY